jgi:uncharacterized protein YoxC
MTIELIFAILILAALLILLVIVSHMAIETKKRLDEVCEEVEKIKSKKK